MTMKIFATAMLASTLLVAPALAQTAGQHDEPPPAGSVEAPAAPTTPNSRPGMSGMMSMMGDGMNMPGMIQMMNGMTGGMGGCMGEAALDHVEGRIAYLRTELHITDAQNAAWSGFADALRAAAQKSTPMAGTMMGDGGLLDRIDRQERALAAKLDGVRALKTAFAPLYAALSDEQKKAAGSLVGPYFSLPMAGMSGMMGGGMMQGDMKPGAAMPNSGMPKPGMGR